MRGTRAATRLTAHHRVHDEEQALRVLERLVQAHDPAALGELRQRLALGEHVLLLPLGEHVRLVELLYGDEDAVVPPARQRDFAKRPAAEHGQRFEVGRPPAPPRAAQQLALARLEPRRQQRARLGRGRRRLGRVRQRAVAPRARLDATLRSLRVQQRRGARRALVRGGVGPGERGERTTQVCDALVSLSLL